MPDQTVPNINILSFQKTNESALGKFLTWSLLYGRIIIILTEFIVIAAFISRFYFDLKLSDLKDAVEVKANFIENSQPIEKEFLRFQGTLDEAGKIIDQRRDQSKVFTNFSSLLPSDIFVKEMTLKDNTFTFSCQIATVPALNSLILNLTSTNKFNDLSIDDIAIKDNQLLVNARLIVTNAAYQ